MRRICELNDKSKNRCIIVMIIQIILTIICQILGWVVQKSYDVYTYKDCTYKLSGATECSSSISDQGDTYSDYGCPGPTTKDCSIGQVIRNLYMAGLIMPLIWYGIIAILTLFIFLCLDNKSFKLKLLFISLIFCDFICVVFYFVDVSMMNNNQNYNILFSQQTLGVCIVLGIFYIIQMFCKIYLNIMVYQYLTQQQGIKDNLRIQNRQILQPYQQYQYTNPVTIRDIQQPHIPVQNQYQQPKPNQQAQEDAELKQVIEISKYEQLQRAQQEAQKRELEEKLLREQQECLRKQRELELEQIEIELVEKLKQKEKLEKEEELKQVILQSMQEQEKNKKQQYLPD